MNNIAKNLDVIRNQINQAKFNAARSEDNISLVAVSKTKPVEDIEHAIRAGQYVFGENYVQEGIKKIQYFSDSDYANKLEWHFIGPLQSNKSKLVAEHFDWIHTVDSLKLISRLGKQRPAHLSKLNVLVQINISQETSKSGIYLNGAEQLIEAIRSEERLVFRGLMAIPAPLPLIPSKSELDNHYRVLSELKFKFNELQNIYPESQIDTISMGMSEDLEIAIKAGSTMVRIGSAIFGARDYSR
ncbi:YggS family pyridoxal phosphate-dependent enzyme [Thorsellia kenyensis]|uniref:Pyridoxal phosphate homeostasis protein n=1 Tax=Thorsellia kenyensis TaxID=1549888 RepID=A0ABV6CD03_9GAMM